MFSHEDVLNEVAFLWGTLARQQARTTHQISNMCHEFSGVALSNSIGIGKGTVVILLDEYLISNRTESVRTIRDVDGSAM